MVWTYTALTRWGQEVVATGTGSKKDILQQLSQQQLDLIEIRPDFKKILMSWGPKKRLSALTLATFFEDLHNMLSTGMNIGQSFLILKETSRDYVLVTALSEMEHQLGQGKSLSESLANGHIFPWIVAVTLATGERTGRLIEATGTLGQYFRRSFQVQSKMQQALIYPAIVFTVLLAVMFFVSVRVIPQLKNLLPEQALHHQTTAWVLALSFFLQQYLWILLAGVVFITGGIYFFRQKYRYRFEQWLYQWPVLGDIFKESALALYLLNLSILLKSGVPLIKAIGDLFALDQAPVAHRFACSRDYMLGGVSFWQAIEQDPFFPLMISSTLRRAEEMTKLEEYCLSLVEFFNKRVSSKVEGLIHTIQPALLVFAGLFLVTIALGFLLPIYGSLTTIAGGAF